MKFFNFRNRKKQNVKDAKKFLDLLNLYNSDLASFRTDKNNMYIIFSDLSKEQLCKIKIPQEAYFEWEPNKSFGYITILYNSKRYVIYAKGYVPR